MNQKNKNNYPLPILPTIHLVVKQHQRKGARGLLPLVRRMAHQRGCASPGMKINLVEIAPQQDACVFKYEDIIHAL